MKQILNIPHRTAHGLCPVNGIRDLIQWRTGNNWSNEFLFGLALGGGFAYLRFNAADPPRQVYWGNASPRQHKYLAELLTAEYNELENRSFKYTWKKAQEYIDKNIAPVIGPLDMFHLNFYEDIYHKRHIPIHYLLFIGYDDEKAYIYDTGHAEMQILPLNELEIAWEVNIPGMGKPNRLVTLDIPQKISSARSLIRRSILDGCKIMLQPPVSMLGIPAMEKVSREITKWPQVLGKDVSNRCLLQVREYLNSPPDISGSHLTAGRDIYVTFLEQAGQMADLDFRAAIEQFQSAMHLLPSIAEAIQQGNLEEASTCFRKIAYLEKRAFTELMAEIGTN